MNNVSMYWVKVEGSFGKWFCFLTLTQANGYVSDIVDVFRDTSPNVMEMISRPVSELKILDKIA